MKIKQYLVQNLRLVSLMPLMLLPAVQALSGHFSLYSLSSTVIVSLALLLSVQPDAQDAPAGLAVSLSVVIMSAAAEALLCAGIIREAVRLPVFSSISATCLAIVQGFRLRRMMGSVEYLSARITGWDVLTENVKIQYCHIYYLLCFASVMMAGAVGRTPGIALSMLFVFLYMLLMLRGTVESRTYGSSRKASLRRLVSRDITLQPDSPERLSVNYRMMYKRICEYMETKRPFLDQNYTIEDMARALYTNKTYLSKLLNTCIHINFSQFVNNYRVRYSMELFKKDQKLKVGELAELSGFNSNVTYTQAFKLFLGIPPGEWCRSWVENVKGKKLRSRGKEAAQ